MKIAVVGKGTSSIITTLVCLLNGHKVEIFYDKDKPHLSVGESTTPHIGELIYKVFEISIGNLLDKNIVSLKNGVKFINWGNSNVFRHHFHNNNIAFHFDSSTFNPCLHNLLEQIGVVYYNEKVNSYKNENNHISINSKEYDFAFFCSGWNTADNDYESPILETVNTALLYEKNEIADPFYTLHEATEHGWQFGLPFPNNNITKHGYLFNRNIDTIDKVRERTNLHNSKLLEWNPKYSKSLLKNKFVALNGNSLFFHEPLQALSLYYYRTFAEMVCLFLENRNHDNFELTNTQYREKIIDYQLSLAWHYQYGSNYKSNFWKQVQKKSKEFFNFTKYKNIETLLSQYCYDKKYREEKYLHIGCFRYLDFEQVHYGMTNFQVHDIIKDVYQYED